LAIGITCLIVGALAMLSGLIGPVGAADYPPLAKYNSYDARLKDEHRGSTSAGKSGDCIYKAGHEGDAAWHFVLPSSQSNEDFESVNATFQNAGEVTDFLIVQNGKGAYVYTDADDTLLDAGGMLTGSDFGAHFNLSHVCASTNPTTTSSSTSTSSSSSTSTSSTSSTSTSTSSTSTSTTSTSTTSTSTTTTQVPTTTTTTTAPTTTTTTAPTTTTQSPTTVVTTQATTTTTGGPTTTAGPTTTTGAVEDTVITQGSVSTTSSSVLAHDLVRGAALPRTGSSSTIPLTELGFVVLLIGVAFIGAARIGTATDETR
jgi:LPXTG-motif cell wall-anchored protein